jgi:APA family basic amino acid/polyamine antiporter
MTLNLEGSQTEEKDSHKTLKSGSFSLVGLIALSMGMTSPALGLYSLLGPIQMTAGPVAPLVFLAATIIALPTAISYSVLNRESPSAGAASTWLWKTLSPDLGFLVGLTMTTYFFMATVLQPLLFGLFFADAVRFFGISDFGMTAMLVGSLIGTILAVLITYRGAEASSRSSIALMIAEVGVVVFLCVSIFAVRAPQHGINLAPFRPTQITGGIAAFWGATLLGILGFCGFDIVSTAAEETNAPREAIPAAIIWTIIASALFWMFTSWILTLSVPAETIRRYVEQGIAPVTQIARLYWGRGSIFVTLTGMTSSLIVYIASVMGSARMLFALSRHGLLPVWLSRLHPRFRVPWNAMHVVYLGAVICTLGSLVLTGNGIEAFTWWGNALVFFALLTFIAVNVANLRYFRVFKTKKVNFFQNLLMPALGVLINVYVIYEAFFHTLWRQEFRTGRSVVVVSLALLVLLIAIVLLTRIFRPSRLLGDPPLEVDS